LREAAVGSQGREGKEGGRKVIKAVMVSRAKNVELVLGCRKVTLDG
jgi:hypothetical protein